MSDSYSPPRCASIRRDDGRPQGIWPEFGSDWNDEDSAEFFGCRLVTQKTDLGKPRSFLARGARDRSFPMPRAAFVSDHSRGVALPPFGLRRGSNPLQITREKRSLRLKATQNPTHF
jgi:hypothetical protein